VVEYWVATSVVLVRELSFPKSLLKEVSTEKIEYAEGDGPREWEEAW